MSSRIGTLQAPKAGRSIWPAALLAALIALTVSVVAVSIGDERSSRAPVSGVAEIAPGVAGTVANTPFELSGGIVGGRTQVAAGTTAANTPTELSGGLSQPVEQPVQPDELTAAERYDLHQRI